MKKLNFSASAFRHVTSSPVVLGGICDRMNSQVPGTRGEAPVLMTSKEYSGVRGLLILVPAAKFVGRALCS